MITIGGIVITTHRTFLGYFLFRLHYDSQKLSETVLSHFLTTAAVPFLLFLITHPVLLCSRYVVLLNKIMILNCSSFERKKNTHSFCSFWSSDNIKRSFLAHCTHDEFLNAIKLQVKHHCTKIYCIPIQIYIY